MLNFFAACAPAYTETALPNDLNPCDVVFKPIRLASTWHTVLISLLLSGCLLVISVHHRTIFLGRLVERSSAFQGFVAPYLNALS